jgi:hypothetical protein
MHLTAIYVFENDADIAIATLSHAASLFDKVICLDFDSVDGTRTILADFTSMHSAFEVFTTPRPFRTRVNSVVNEIARFLSRNSTDWVFALAAMEFPKFENREHLEQVLGRKDGGYLTMRPIFPAPSSYGDFCNFDFNQTFNWSGMLGQAVTIACSSFNALSDNLSIYLLRSSPPPEKTYLSEFSALDVPLLPSLPIRSGSRLSVHLSDDHWALQTLRKIGLSDILKAGEQDFEDVSVLDGLIINVLDRNRSFQPIDRDCVSLLPTRLPEGAVGDSGGRALTHSQFVAALKSLRGTPLSSDAPGKTDMLDTTPRGYHLEAGRVEAFPMALRGDGILQSSPFFALPSSASHLETRDKLELFNKLILAATTPVATIPFSAWYTLAPVLFCLFELFKPRRYVELGTHHGYSFFAACQGSELAGSKTECIAIDSWAGDPHAGVYDSDVYDSVRRYLTSTYPSQYTLKSFFSDALNSFEDGSIDLLHIDGFHTYEAVKNDFEQWLPKLSERGIILFHDTNVYERDFGVYMFWDCVRRRYPSFEFCHSY